MPDAARTRTPTTPAELSRLLFEARELIEMYADVVEAQMQLESGSAEWPRRVVGQIDAYRTERGWSLEGFGGEGIV